MSDIRLKLIQSPTLKCAVRPYFPGSVAAGSGITISLVGNVYTVAVDLAPIVAAMVGNYQPIDGDLSAISALSGTGIMVRTAADTWVPRQLVAPAAGITITNPAGIAGNPTFALANDLAALEALSGTSTIYYRSGADTWSAVTIGAALSFTTGTLDVADNGVSNTKLADMAAYTLKARNAGTTGDPSDVDISALTEKATLAGDDLYLIQDSAASNAFKKVKAKTIANTAHDVVVLTAGTSWTVPTGCYVIHHLELWGGGGGGGRCTGAVPGSGGGGGGCAVSGGIAVTPGASITIAIGAGGAGSTGANAGTGGTTTFDTISATGGTGGGDDGGAGGGAGSGSGGDLNLGGQQGQQPASDVMSIGGSAPRGGFGGITGIGAGAPSAGNVPGGGGGGGSTNGVSQNGAAGAAGRIMIVY